jgi:putative ABC transport system permease protein
VLHDGGYDRVLGKEMKLNNKLVFFINGVVADPPLNTSLPFKFMIEYESVEEIFPFYQPDSWTSTSSNAHVYFLMAENVTAEQVEDVLPDLVAKYLTEENADTQKSFTIQAMPDFHFSPELGTYGELATEKESLAIPIAVGVFLILTACVNFINLSTALAIKRAKEVGIRKVLGGVKGQLIFQFLGETFLITLISVFISMGASELIMKNMQELIGYNLSLDIVNDPILLLIVVSIVVLVTLLAGLYPSFVLARLKPAATLRSKGQSAVSGNVNVRRGLVVFQFLISQFLVICTLVVISQMQFFQNKDLGFKKSGIITFPLPTQETDKMSTMKNRLMNFAGVEMVSYGFASPQSSSNIGSTFNYELVQGGANMDAAYKIVDENYVPLYEIELLAGRNFRENDTIDVALISEDVMRLMEIDDPNDALGKVIGSGSDQ